MCVQDKPQLCEMRDANIAIHASNWNEEILSYDDMQLPEDLLRAVFKSGLEKPSVIEQRGIRPITLGKDVVAQAQSGTGQMATYAIGALATIDSKLRQCQSLILAPTRENAEQIQKVVASLGENMGITTHVCSGGIDARNDVLKLKCGVHVVVGTPGRISHMIERRALRLENIRQLFLHEADEMLSLGCKDQISGMIKSLPDSVQICAFTSTMPIEVVDLTERCMCDPVRIVVKKDVLSLEGIKQFYVALDSENWKLDSLCELYEELTITQAIIYCNSRRKVEWLQDQLDERDFSVSCLHEDMTQSEYDSTISEFRSGSSRILITTDLQAGDIDTRHVSLVFNFDVPLNMENYLERIGRSSRFGRKRAAINFVTHGDAHKLREIEKYYRTDIFEMPQNVSDVI